MVGDLYDAIKIWFDGGTVSGIETPKTSYLKLSLLYCVETLVRYSEYNTVCEDEIPYYKYFGLNVTPTGIGWKITNN